MGFAIKGRLTGVEEAIKSLKGVSARVKNNALRKGLRRGAALIKSAARAKVPVRFGWLKKSIDSKIVVKGSRAYAIVGPTHLSVKDKKGKRQLSRLGKAMAKEGVTGIDPSAYAHLVEYGHAGPNGSGAATQAHPFMRPAWDGNKDRAAQELANAIEEELTK